MGSTEIELVGKVTYRFACLLQQHDSAKRREMLKTLDDLLTFMLNETSETKPNLVCLKSQNRPI